MMFEHLVPVGKGGMAIRSRRAYWAYWLRRNRQALAGSLALLTLNAGVAGIVWWMVRAR